MERISITCELVLLTKRQNSSNWYGTPKCFNPLTGSVRVVLERAYLSPSTNEFLLNDLVFSSCEVQKS